MSKESPYKVETFGPALLIALLIACGLGLLGLLLWGITALFLYSPVGGFFLVFGVLSFVGLIFLVQYLDDKYGWFDLDGWL